MTEKQYRSLARYAGRIAKELRLDHIDLSLKSEGPGETKAGDAALASFEGTYGRHSGVIRVSHDFDHFPPEEQRIAILHELIHCHTEQIREYARISLMGALGREAYEVFWSGYTQQDELFTDALATALAPRFPLWDGK